MKNVKMGWIFFGLAFAFAIVSMMGCSGPLQFATNQGQQGAAGPTGTQGIQGDSCSTVSVSASNDPNRPDEYGGALITCGNTETFVANGTPGQVGATGLQGTQGVTGATGSDGLQGVTGEKGSSGATGGTGSQGVQGNTGSQGQNGTIVTTIEFCADGHTIYPSNFPEQGICIDDNIYAVYWNGSSAWLAEIVPGKYKSTATGLECDFTVLANCEIGD